MKTGSCVLGQAQLSDAPLLCSSPLLLPFPSVLTSDPTDTLLSPSDLALPHPRQFTPSLRGCPTFVLGRPAASEISDCTHYRVQTQLVGQGHCPSTLTFPAPEQCLTTPHRPQAAQAPTGQNRKL